MAVQEWFVVWQFWRVARVCRVVDEEVFEWKLTESGTARSFDQSLAPAATLE
jgi:hypothetical protein